MSSLNFGSPTDALPDVLPLPYPRSSTYNIYKSDSYLDGRTTNKESRETFSEISNGDRGELDFKSVAEVGCPTPQHFESASFRMGQAGCGEVGHPPQNAPADSPSLPNFTAQRERLLAILDGLPTIAERKARRLAMVTRAFLDIPQFGQAVQYGWSDLELYGLARQAPEVRLAEQGLVSGLALSALNSPKLVEIFADRAVIRCGSGAQLSYSRFSGNTDCAVSWWEIPAFRDPLPSTAEQE